MKEGQNEQLKSVREHIRNCFEDIFSFLLPYPGKKMTSSKDFDGRLAGQIRENKTSHSLSSQDVYTKYVAVTLAVFNGFLNVHCNSFQCFLTAIMCISNVK